MPTPADRRRRPTRRGSVQLGRRGRDGHGLRFHQRPARGPLALRDATWPARSRGIITRRQAARRRHDLRLQRRAHQAPWPMPPRRAGRQLVVAGRAMHRIIGVAMDTGYLPQQFQVSRPGALLLPRAATRWCCCAPAARASRARRWPASPRTSIPTSSSTEGDLVIFSSRTIPGNERAVGRIQNRLVDLGCEIVTDGDALVHVTGHPAPRGAEGDVRLGEAAHRHPHARRGAASLPSTPSSRAPRASTRCSTCATATSCGWRRAPAEIIDEAPVGRLFRDGDLLVPSEDGPVRERRVAGLRRHRHRRAGAVGPRRGVGRRRDRARRRAGARTPQGGSMLDIVRDAVEGTLASIPRDRRRDGETGARSRAARGALARGGRWGKRPIAKVLLTQAPR